MSKEQQRPLSPHLQVYKPQLTSILSILHRATGVFLSLGLVVFVYWLLALAGNPALADKIISFFQSFIGGLALFAWVFAFCYHFCNGIRHLFWDVGKGFDIPTVYRSGAIMLTASVLLTVLVYAVAFWA